MYAYTYTYIYIYIYTTNDSHHPILFPSPFTLPPVLLLFLALLAETETQDVAALLRVSVYRAACVSACCTCTRR